VTRIVVEVPAANAPAETAAPPAATPPNAAATPPPAAEAPPVLTTPRGGIQTIVIDPGHGGGDAGVRGRAGVEEKAVTLAVAQALRGMIEARLGIRVILTREDDRAVGADERAALANNSKADLFLSLHANAAPSAAVSGAEVFHLRLDEAGEEARRSAQADSVALPVLGGANRTIEIVRWDLAQVRHVESSGVLAAMIAEELRGRVSMGPRPQQQAPLRVLVGANMPAALVEMAYLSNAEQEKVAASEAYQGLVAQALYEAVVRFRAYADGRPE
jgi:N-acetylmuramoyl-L-alanine amidase